MTHQHPMELIRQPNRWSCNACAWAMVLGLTLDEVIAAVGVKGKASDRLDDEELIWVAVQRGYACTSIKRGSERSWRKWPTEAALAAFIGGKRGVLAVTHPQIQEGLHAVAWDGQVVYDPLLGIHDLLPYRLLEFIWIEQTQREAA